MKVKICGLMRGEDALLAAQCGADFLGLIFVPGSPRRLAPDQAAELVAFVRARHAGAKFAGVFRNAPNDTIRRVVETVRLDYAQLHGDESDEQVAALALPVIKTLSVRETLPSPADHPSAQWLLFDTHGREGGGTGRTFDWSLLSGAPRPRQPFLLAGGLNADNVVAAIAQVRPDAIDLASGVESAPGIKDPAKVRQLFTRIAEWHTAPAASAIRGAS